MKYIAAFLIMFPVFTSADWVVEESPLSKHLYGVAIDNQGNPWAVGSDGTILKRENGEWTIQSSPTGADLYAVTKDDVGTLWAVGRYGVIIKNEGAGFVEVNSPVNEDLWSVTFGDTIGVAVGTYGAIIKYTDGAWSETGSPTDWGLYGVDLANDNSGWAVGANRLILYWDGNAFSQVTDFDPIPGLTINTVFCIDENDAWAGGAVGKIYHYSNGNWVEVLLDTFYGHHGLYFLSPNEGWAVGIYAQVYKYENGEWSNAGPVEGLQTNFRGVSFNPSGVGWAVGTNGAIIRYSPTAVEPTSLGRLKAAFAG